MTLESAKKAPRGGPLVPSRVVSGRTDADTVFFLDCFPKAIFMNNTRVRSWREAAMPQRRDFLRKALLLALPVAGVSLPATLFAAPGTSITLYNPPSRVRGSAMRTVRDFGARGDGSTDDTTAFQNAFDSLPSSGGTVVVPAGIYLIDPVRSIRPRSKTHLKLSDGAKLIAKPNGSDKAYVIYVYKVSDVEISGGQIIGDRDQHQDGDGEWGHGIFVRGAERVTVRDIHISKCWGDGMSVGAALVWQDAPIPSKDVVVANIVSTGNRRQGLSIGRVYGMKVYDSEFSNTHGTTPECGIDIEPDLPGIAYAVHIENCLIRGNAVYGLLVYKRAQGVTIKHCIVEGNGSCGIVTRGCAATYIASNTIRNNSATGLFIQDGTVNCQASQNTFINNYTRNGPRPREPFSMAGVSSRNERDILIRGSVSDIRITTNHYR